MYIKNDTFLEKRRNNSHYLNKNFFFNFLIKNNKQNPIIISMNQNFSTSNDENSKEDLTGDGGLMKEILKEGNGEKAENGFTVKVNYTGNLETGEVFDSSLTRNEPYMFTIGEGKVIKGWEIGVKTMKIGEKSKFSIFPEYAYKKKGIPPIIPPNAKLTFEIELLDIIKTSETEKKIKKKSLSEIPRTPEDISNEFKNKMAAKGSLSKKKTFDDFFFISPFKSQSGEKAPWWLNPNITFVLVFSIVFLLFFTIFSIGGIHQGYVDGDFDANILN
mmetsp:Transcript_42111/g.99829  ORF Transcript_42111/g.99829 Transcript_42111/m.99829 type:complete len:274 (-) Transcript_42111:193-1014(-)